MNNQQRTFLVKKITDTVAKRLQVLKDSMPEPPSISNYLLHAVMSNNFTIRNNDEIKEMIRQKALNAKGSDNWMSKNGWGSASNNTIEFKASDLFVLPDEYTKLYEKYKADKAQLEEEIYSIKLQSESLITRIQLASDKTLQTMINEVDDMGNISLMDTKIKFLTDTSVNKQIKN